MRDTIRKVSLYKKSPVFKHLMVTKIIVNQTNRKHNTTGVMTGVWAMG